MDLAKSIATRVLGVIDRGDRVRKFRNYHFRDHWLRRVENVVHVGANVGQEASQYAAHNLGVLWIEPIPSVFAELEKNIGAYPNQRACQALVADVMSKQFTLKIASNGGASSSIFDLAEHREIWPDIDYIGTIDLTSRTLNDILSTDPRWYDALVMDTQGSELLVLKGAEAFISRFKYIKTEAVDFEMYRDCATSDQLINFLAPRGFSVARRDVFAKKPDGTGKCFNLLFKRQ